jgi:NAD-dependent dihydropyrimidine dehydrogenase PreA subunit
MRIEVDLTRCTGTAGCAGKAPGVEIAVRVCPQGGRKLVHDG